MCCLPLLCTAILTVSYKFYLMTDIWYRLRSRDESRNQVLLVQGARPLVPISRHCSWMSYLSGECNVA